MTRLISFWTMPRKAMNNAVVAPTTGTNAHAVREKRLEIRIDCAFARIPEADQQVRHEPHRLPSEKKLEEVVAHHEHQHREREERYVGEEARVAGIVGHVADRVDVDHQRY